SRNKSARTPSGHSTTHTAERFWKIVLRRQLPFVGLYFGGFRPLLAVFDIVQHPLPFFQARRVYERAGLVEEDVFTAAAGDEAVAARRVVPLQAAHIFAGLRVNLDGRRADILFAFGRFAAQLAWFGPRR